MLVRNVESRERGRDRWGHRDNLIAVEGDVVAKRLLIPLLAHDAMHITVVFFVQSSSSSTLQAQSEAIGDRLQAQLVPTEHRALP